MSENVGLAIKAAFDRAASHCQASSRRLTIRICSGYGAAASPEAFTIVVRIAVREDDPAEVDLFNKGLGEVVRRIPWEELDAEAKNLAGWVDNAVYEVKRNFGLLA